MGGRGADSGDLGNVNSENFNASKDKDIWAYRHNPNNERFVDNINTTIKDMADTYKGLMGAINDVYMAKVNKDTVMAYWAPGTGELGFSNKYGSMERMAKSYEECVKEGFHPSNGNKTAEQAITAHEIGHALTSVAQKNMGSRDFDEIAKKVVQDAKSILNKQAGKTRYRGTRKIAAGISEYAKSSNAECIAEATSDVYCNGSKASRESKAVVEALKKYL